MRKLAALISAGVLFALSCTKPGLPSNPNASPGADDVKLTFYIPVSSDKLAQRIPADFTGLSFESEELVHDDYFNPANTGFINLIKGLGAGQIRIGGGSADHTYWNIGKDGSVADSVWLTSSDVDRYFSFAAATGWKTMYTLNMSTTPPWQIASQASYIQSKYGAQLSSFEIGNEPDLYGLSGARPSSYTFEQFKNEWNDRYLAVRAAVPDAVFSGPDVSGNAWVGAFAAREHQRLSLLTEHFYQLYIAGDTIVTIAKLLGDESRLKAQIKVLQYESAQYGLGYRINETSSVNGALSGVSNTLAAAIWGLDFMYTLAENGCAGVNFHGGGNQAHTPIADSNGMFYARPLYYSMLLFSQAAGAKVLPVTAGPGQTLNLNTYAVKTDDGKVLITLINKDLSQQAYVALYVGSDSSSNLQGGGLMRLTGSAPDVQTGVTLGGAAVQQDGTWAAAGTTERAALVGNLCTVRVPACSAVMITLQ